MNDTNYVGLEQDLANGLTPLARIVLDARLFGLVAADESCAGWEPGRIQQLYERVFAAWAPYGHMPSNLPDGLRQQHAHMYAQSIETARRAGWDPELGDDD